MTPISSSEMLKQFLEDQVQTNSINNIPQSEPSTTMTTIVAPPTQATPQTLPEQHQAVPNLISSLLQQSTNASLNSPPLGAQHTDCNSFPAGTADQLLNLMKPPDIPNQAPVSDTPLQSVNIPASDLTDVLNQMLSNPAEVTKGPAITEALPMITSAYSCNTNTVNSALLAGAFSTEALTMVTPSGLQTNSFATTGTSSVSLANACIISVISNNSNLLPIKSETLSPVGQVTSVYNDDHHTSANSTFTQAVTTNQQSNMSAGIGGNIASNDVNVSPVKMVTNPAPVQQPQGVLPADLANVRLQMFPPVSSLPTGNIGPQSVLVSNTNRQTNSDVPPTDTHASFNQGPFSTNSNIGSTNATNFLNVEIPDQNPAVISDEIRDILVNDTKPKLTLQANPARTEQQHSMLRQMLTNSNEVDNSSLSPSPVSSPEDNVPESASSISSPNSVFHDTVSQLTLINKSAELNIGGQDDDAVTDMWDISCFKPDPLETDVPNKVQKSKHNTDAHSDLQSEISVEKLFDAGGADSTMDFKFTKFGQEKQAVFTFGSSKNVSASPAASTNVRTPALAPAAETGSLKSMAPPIQKPHKGKVKDTGLGAQFPSRTPNYELRIISQPEEQHRARYLTEGSRGAVKDRSQQSHPVVKLLGHSDNVGLQVFVGNETGRVKPHGFYQACKVCGKNSTPSVEKEIDGTVVIETEMSPASDMTVSVDCVGILKLRNADVEKRIGVAKARAKKKNSTRARLIFRVTFQKPDGNYQTLQVASSPIICTQPVGQPEISKMSLDEAPTTGGQELFVIGKNFLKGTQVKFQEISTEDGATLWNKEADIDQEYFQQTHLICKIPEYRIKTIPKPVMVQIVINCRGKISEPQEFYYNPYFRIRG